MKLLRVNSWWNTIVPQVLGWIYFCVLTLTVFGNNSPSDYTGIIQSSVLFFIALISISSFGYLFNDWCDIEADAQAGKPNSLAAFHTGYRGVIVFIPLTLGVIAWLLLNKLCLAISGKLFVWGNIFFALQIISLVLYSAKPFRLKDRAELGIVADAFYGHLNPVLITLAVFTITPATGNWHFIFMLVIFLLCFVKGMRNILLHQIEDRKKDLEAQSNTAVIKYGPWRIINFINHFLFPAEIFLLVCLMLIISVHIPPFIIPLILFAVFSYLKMSGWKIGYADRRLLEFKFSYFMNDFYENWLPVFTLIILSVYQHQFVFLLILHLILFPGFIMKLVKDTKTIRENFKTEEDY